MPAKPTAESWWHTLPGILTAIAALLTAGAAFLAALNQTGLIETIRDWLPDRIAEALPSSSDRTGDLVRQRYEDCLAELEPAYPADRRHEVPRDCRQLVLGK